MISDKDVKIVINGSWIGHFHSYPIGTKIKATDAWGTPVGYGRVGVSDNEKIEVEDYRVRLLEHDNVNWIDFTKMVAAVKEGVKFRYRRVTVNHEMKYVCVHSALNEFAFGDTVYDQYIKYCNDLIVK